jgi:biotin synthase
MLDSYATGSELKREHLIALLGVESTEELLRIQEKVNEVRREWVGDAVHIRGIIEFSNYCTRSCAYCGLNRHNRSLKRYRMTPEDIVTTALKASKMGFRTIVLQSGEDPFFTAEILADVIREIKKTGTAVTLSVGERPARDYQLWREVGADRYLLKFETSNPALYARLHPGSSLKNRLRCLQDLHELGYQVGSGNIVGLPRQEAGILADDLLLMRELKLEMAGIGPFLPHPGTTLARHPAPDVSMCLKVLALARLVIPWAHLPATTALGCLNPDGFKLGLEWGANVLMASLTPAVYRQYYEIYPQKAQSDKAVQMKLLASQLRRDVAADPGHGLLTLNLNNRNREVKT